MEKIIGEYVPVFLAHRVYLASEIISALSTKGFEIIDAPQSLSAGFVTKELLMDCVIKDNIRVRVFTTIVKSRTHGLEVRAVGADAIRIILMTSNGLGLVKTTRVNRTGTIQSIISRIMQRVEDVRGKLCTVTFCKDCGAPQFLTKKNSKVCTNFCWKKPALQTLKIQNQVKSGVMDIPKHLDLAHRYPDIPF